MNKKLVVAILSFSLSTTVINYPILERGSDFRRSLNIISALGSSAFSIDCFLNSAGYVGQYFDNLTVGRLSPHVNSFSLHLGKDLLLGLVFAYFAYDGFKNLNT